MKRVDSRPRKEGWKQAAPGIYEDAQGQIHLSIPELLEIFSVADTPENRQVLTEAAQAMAAEQWPGIKVEVRE